MSKIVTLIIPTLNEEKFIRSCLETVFVQTFPTEDMEIIVADGGSNDRTCEIVMELSERWKNIRLIHNPKKIQSCAFNLGVAITAAPYVLRMDAHTTMHPEYIERCVKYLMSDVHIGNVGGRCLIRPANDSLMANANAILNHSRFGIGGSSFRVATEAAETDSVPFGAFRRDVLEKIGGMREDLPRGEDNEFNSRIRKAGYKVWFDPQIVTTYFARPTLKTSAKQMYGNGVSIAWLWNIDKESLGIRHLVPFVFLLSIPISLGVTLIPYVIVAIIATIQLCNKEGWKYFLPLLVLFPAIHLSYGWGTLMGFLRKNNHKC